MIEIILYAEDEGIALPSTAIDESVYLRVEDVTNERIAFAINTNEYIKSDASKIIQLHEDDKSKHFRSLLNIGDEVSLFKNDDRLPEDELVHIYFSGHGIVSIYGSEHVGIKKNKSYSNTALKIFMPSHVESSIEYIREAEPTELEEIEHTLHHAINTIDKLHGLKHANPSNNLKDTINSEILFLEGRIASLKAKKKSLSKRPQFEAANRKFLIEELESFMKRNGYTNEFNRIKSEALRKATESIGATVNDSYEQHKKRLKEHPLNNRFIDFFKTGRPTPLPLFKCEQCGSRPLLSNSKNPSTGKKRYIITCSHCDNKPNEHIHGHASNAIYHWTKDCASVEASPSDVKPLLYNEAHDGSFSDYAKLLTEYIDIYKAFLKSYKDVHDHDSAHFVSAAMGKLRHLSDGVLIGKFIQKRINSKKFS